MVDAYIVLGVEKEPTKTPEGKTVSLWNSLFIRFDKSDLGKTTAPVLTEHEFLYQSSTAVDATTYIGGEAKTHGYENEIETLIRAYLDVFKPHLTNEKIKINDNYDIVWGTQHDQYPHGESSLQASVILDTHELDLSAEPYKEQYELERVYNATLTKKLSVDIPFNTEDETIVCTYNVEKKLHSDVSGSTTSLQNYDCGQHIANQYAAEISTIYNAVVAQKADPAQSEKVAIEIIKNASNRRSFRAGPSYNSGGISGSVTFN